MLFFVVFWGFWVFLGVFLRGGLRCQLQTSSFQRQGNACSSRKTVTSIFIYILISVFSFNAKKNGFFFYYNFEYGWDAPQYFFFGHLVPIATSRTFPEGSEKHACRKGPKLTWYFGLQFHKTAKKVVSLCVV